MNPYFGAQPLVIDQDFKNPRATQFGVGFEREWRRGFTAAAEFIYVKTDNLQRNREMNLAGADDPGDRLGAAAVLRHARRRAPMRRWVGAGARVDGGIRVQRPLTLTARAAKAVGQVNGQLRAQQVESDDDNERDSGGAGSDEHVRLRPRVGAGAHWTGGISSTATCCSSCRATST